MTRDDLLRALACIVLAGGGWYGMERSGRLARRALLAERLWAMRGWLAVCALSVTAFFAGFYIGAPLLDTQ